MMQSSFCVWSLSWLLLQFRIHRYRPAKTDFSQNLNVYKFTLILLFDLQIGRQCGNLFYSIQCNVQSFLTLLCNNIIITTCMPFPITSMSYHQLLYFGEPIFFLNFLFPAVERAYTFPVFTPEFCQKFLEEIINFENSDCPKGRPNTMNNYGVCHVLLLFNFTGFMSSTQIMQGILL